MSDETRGVPHDPPDNPSVVAPPPLIYAGTLAAGLLMNRLYPAAFLPRGLSLMLLGRRAMRRAGTNISLTKPATKIVTEGPYHFTRNPLYLSLTLVYGGITALRNALWAALLLPGVLYVMRRGVIEREEHYLERKFGDEYLRYKRQVRRWL